MVVRCASISGRKDAGVLLSKVLTSMKVGKTFDDMWFKEVVGATKLGALSWQDNGRKLTEKKVPGEQKPWM